MAIHIEGQETNPANIEEMRKDKEIKRKKNMGTEHVRQKKTRQTDNDQDQAAAPITTEEIKYVEIGIQTNIGTASSSGTTNDQKTGKNDHQQDVAVQTLLQPTTETTRTSSGVGLETGRQPKTHTATCICDFFGLTPAGHFKATATARKIYNWRHYVLYLFRFGAKSVERYGNTAENNYRKVEEELIKLDVCNEDNDEAQKICEEYFDERKEKQNEYREQSHRQRNNMVETLNELLTTYNINTFTEWIKKNPL